MNVLITGGVGNLGSRLLVPLIQRGDRVVLFDRVRRPFVATPEFQQAEVVEGELGDQDAVFAGVRSRAIESIFHLGAILSSHAEEQPDLAWQVNMEGTRNVLEAARRFGVKRVIFSSTVATYGAGLPTPLPLDSPQWPVSLYGVTKVAGERLGVYYRDRFGLDFRGVRLPAVVAAHGSAGGVSAFCSAAFEESVRRGRYEFYLRPSTRAPMIYISDAVRGLLELHDAPVTKLRSFVYNLSGFSPSAEELGASIQKRLPHVNITFKPDPLRVAIVESWPGTINDSNAKRDWGWEARYDLDRATGEVIDILQNEPKGESSLQ